MTAPHNCQQCAACCCSTLDTYVRVTGDDWTRLGDAAEEAAHFIGHRAFMKMKGGHCAALAMRRPTDDRVEFFCSLYEQRPQICRDLARGSPECAAELHRKATVTRRLFAMPADEGS